MELLNFLKFLLFGFLIHCSVLINGFEDVDQAEEITISEHEYCIGCKDFVVFLTDMVAKNVVEKSKAKAASLGIDEVVYNICDNPRYEKMKTFTRATCLKILNEESSKVFPYYAGQLKGNMMSNKKEIYDKIYGICYNDVSACGSEVVVSSNQTGKQRNRCNACHIIADDIYDLSNLYRDETVFSTFLKEEFCNQVGYFHQPYSWLEDYCDELIDDKLKSILGSIHFYNDLVKSSIRPNETPGELICREAFKCSHKI